MARSRKDPIYIATRKRFASHVVKSQDHSLGERIEAAAASPDLGDPASQVREVLDQLRTLQVTV